MLCSLKHNEYLETIFWKIIPTVLFLDAVGWFMVFAIVDYLTYIDVGGNGGASDSAVFWESILNITMENKTTGFPEHSLIVGDTAFRLIPGLIKLFTKWTCLAIV